MQIGAPEVFSTKAVSCWADAADGQQCGMSDMDVLNDLTALQESLDTTCPISPSPARSPSSAWQLLPHPRAPSIPTPPDPHVLLSPRHLWLPVCPQLPHTLLSLAHSSPLHCSFPCSSLHFSPTSLDSLPYILNVLPLTSTRTQINLPHRMHHLSPVPLPANGHIHSHLPSPFCRPPAHPTHTAPVGALWRPLPALLKPSKASSRLLSSSLTQNTTLCTLSCLLRRPDSSLPRSRRLAVSTCSSQRLGASTRRRVKQFCQRGPSWSCSRSSATSLTWPLPWRG